MNTEQERADFETWLGFSPVRMSDGGYADPDVCEDWRVWQARATLQSQPIESAAREIALWAYGEVGADPELTPGLAQLLHHFGISDDVPVAPQSQDREDAERYRYLRDSAQLFSHFGDIGNSGWCVMRRDHTIRRVFTYNGPELDEAIDHARRVEGELCPATKAS